MTLGVEMTKKTLFLIGTVWAMLCSSGLAVWLIQATVQIDDDIGILVVFLLLLNAAIIGLSTMIYKRI